MFGSDRKRKNTEQQKQREEIEQILQECEDRLYGSKEVGRLCRGLMEEIKGQKDDIPVSPEMEEVLQDALNAARNRDGTMALKSLERFSSLKDGQGKTKNREEKEKMGLFDRILKRKTEDKGTSGMIGNAEREIEKSIYELEVKIAELSKKKSILQAQFDNKVAQARSVVKDSAEYQLLKTQAMALKPQMDAVDKMLQAFFRAMLQNNQVRAAFESGQLMEDLKRLLPDTIKVDAIMDMIGNVTAETQQTMDDLDTLLSSHDAGFKAAMEKNVSIAKDDEFDNLVSSQPVKSQAAAPQAEAAQTAPPQAASPQAAAPQAAAPQMAAAQAAAPEAAAEDDFDKAVQALEDSADTADA